MRKKLILALLALSVISVAAPCRAELRSDKLAVESNLSVFSEIVKQLQTNYVDTIDMDNIVKMAIDVMLYSLDPYTEYYPQKEQKEFRSINSGSYAGIGSVIVERDGKVFIHEPYLGSPAATSGLRPGDRILAVDTTEVSAMGTSAVSDMLKGARGTVVKVRVNRPYAADSVMTFEIKRDKINIPAVNYAGVVDPGIGYIHLEQFSEKSADEVKTALQKMLTEDRISGLVLDLRGNGGGYLESAVKILGYFLPKGTEVLRTRGRQLLEERVYKTTSKPIAPDLPLVVLTDGASASASEITAGALQDLDRAVILGTRSFGKGLVQSTFGLPQDGMIKITTAKYYIPSGRLIQAIDYAHRAADGTAERIADSLTSEFHTAAGRTVRDGGGITPDVVVELPDVSRVTYNVVADNWAFDYATKFASEHPTIAPAEDFEITDSIYADFKRFIDPERFNYDRVCDQALDQLRKLATVEGYMTDSLETQIGVLQQMMHQSLDKNLDVHRDAIAPYLAAEIVRRYYYKPGEIRNALRRDKTFLEAVKVLDDHNRYASILRPDAKKK